VHQFSGVGVNVAVTGMTSLRKATQAYGTQPLCVPGSHGKSDSHCTSAHDPNTEIKIIGVSNSKATKRSASASGSARTQMGLIDSAAGGVGVFVGVPVVVGVSVLVGVWEGVNVGVLVGVLDGV